MYVPSYSWHISMQNIKYKADIIDHNFQMCSYEELAIILFKKCCPLSYKQHTLMHCVLKLQTNSLNLSGNVHF
jgi:hypothetical protein